MDDRRNAERVEPAQQPNGEFRLFVEEKSYCVNAVQDISPFGVKVEIETFLDIDETVRLTYESENENLSVSGSVMWSVAVDLGAKKDRSSKRKKAGIYFEPRDMEANLHFFRALTGMG